MKNRVELRENLEVSRTPREICLNDKGNSLIGIF